MKKLFELILNWFNKKEAEAQTVPVPPPVPDPVVPPPLTPQQRLARRAEMLLKPVQDISPKDYAPDEVGCVESAFECYKQEFGVYPNGSIDKIELSTIEAFTTLKNNPKFNSVLEMQPGLFIISVSGQGKNFYHGHIGIILENGLIASNNSSNGNWDTHLTVMKWVDYFVRGGGFKIYLFKPI